MLLEPKFSATRSIQLMKEYPVSHFIYIGELIRYINQVPEEPSDKDIKLKQICGNGLNTTEWVKLGLSLEISVQIKLSKNLRKPKESSSTDLAIMSK